MSRLFVALLAAVYLLASTMPAHAYLDPQNSSLILQAVAGGIAGMAVLLRVLWRRFIVRLGFKGSVRPL